MAGRWLARNCGAQRKYFSAEGEQRGLQDWQKILRIWETNHRQPKATDHMADGNCAPLKNWFVLKPSHLRGPRGNGRSFARTERQNDMEGRPRLRYDRM